MAEQNQLSPELVVLSKKLNQAQAEYDSLRTSMVQQVSNFRKLVKAIFDLDDGYFGGRFQSQEGTEGKTPQQDLAMALQVVEAISDELQGASAFADSPLLRDQVANLVAAVDELRAVSIETDRAATQALSFTGGAAAAVFPARTFPENNPLACLTEAVGFLRDLQSLVARMKDRVGALVLMAQEADEARNEAEAATANVVESRSADKIAGSLSAELAARDTELSALRSHSLKEQETHAEEIRRIRGEIRERISAAQESVVRETELHRADVAEARSLVSEIERLAAADPESASSDDLDITLGVLRDALNAEANDEPGISGLTAAAEAVLSQWARIINERAASAVKELSTLRWQLGEANSRSEALQTEVTRLTAESKRLHESEKGFTNAREAVSKELSSLRTQVAEQARELHGRELTLKTRDEAAARVQEQTQRLADDLAKERSGRDEERVRHQEALKQAQGTAQETVGQFESVIQRARSAAEDAEKQLAEVRGQLGGLRAEADAARAEATRIQAEVAHHTEALKQAQAREVQATDARERAERQVKDQRAKTEAGAAEAGHLRGEVERLNADLTKASRSLADANAREQVAITARDTVERARAELAAKLDTAVHARQLADTQLTATKQRLDEMERELAALTAVRDRLARTEAGAADIAVRLTQAEQAATAAKAESARLSGELQRVQTEAQSRDRRATEADGERGRTQTLLSERDKRIAELGAESDRLRQAHADAQAKAEHTAAELSRLKTLYDGAVQARDQATTELAAKLKSEAAATAERDTAKAALTTAYAERDRLQAQAERQRADLEAQAKVQRSREDEFSARLGDASRQTSEAKQVAQTLQAENDRLRAEIDKTTAQAERVETRSASEVRATAETAARAERKATETAKLADAATARAATIERELSDMKAQVAELTTQLHQAQEAERNYADRVETDDAIGQANAKRWTKEREELISLIKDSKLAVQNAKIARESDLQRVAELEGELTILKSLK